MYEYLKARMMAIAPNLTVLLGDLVGARLISNAGKFFIFKFIYLYLYEIVIGDP